MSPFDLYSTAAEKVAWNAIDTLEKDIALLLGGADNGIGITRRRRPLSSASWTTSRR